MYTLTCFCKKTVSEGVFVLPIILLIRYFLRFPCMYHLIFAVCRYIIILYLYTHFAFSGLAAPHNSDYVVFLFLDYKAQAFDLTTMLYTGCDNIDTGSIDGAVSQNIGQLGDVLFDAVKSAGEEFSQIVWKDF